MLVTSFGFSILRIHYLFSLNLSSFQITKVLNNNVIKKLIVVQGKFKDKTDPAIIILEKKTFPNEEDFLQSKLFHDDTELEKLHHNDIYGKYECYPTKEYTGKVIVNKFF